MYGIFTYIYQYIYHKNQLNVGKIPYMDPMGIIFHRAYGIPIVFQFRQSDRKSGAWHPKVLKFWWFKVETILYSHYDWYIDLVMKPINIDDTAYFCLQDLIFIPHSLIRKLFFASHNKTHEIWLIVSPKNSSRENLWILLRCHPWCFQSKKRTYPLDNFFATPTLTWRRTWIGRSCVWVKRPFCWPYFWNIDFQNSVFLWEQKERVSFSSGRRSFMHRHGSSESNVKEIHSATVPTLNTQKIVWTWGIIALSCFFLGKDQTTQ